MNNAGVILCNSDGLGGDSLRRPRIRAMLFPLALRRPNSDSPKHLPPSLNQRCGLWLAVKSPRPVRDTVEDMMYWTKVSQMGWGDGGRGEAGGGVGWRG